MACPCPCLFVSQSLSCDAATQIPLFVITCCEVIAWILILVSRPSSRLPAQAFRNQAYHHLVRAFRSRICRLLGDHHRHLGHRPSSRHPPNTSHPLGRCSRRRQILARHLQGSRRPLACHPEGQIRGFLHLQIQTHPINHHLFRGLAHRRRFRAVRHRRRSHNPTGSAGSSPRSPSFWQRYSCLRSSASCHMGLPRR
jgi:hypothetical protein